MAKAKRGFLLRTKALKEEAANGDFVAAMKDFIVRAAAAVKAVQDANADAVNALAHAEAKREKRDLGQWEFNLTSMRWQERTTQLKEGAR